MTRPRKDRLPVPGRPPKDGSRAFARAAARNRVKGTNWVGRLARETERAILADAGELSAGALLLAEIAAKEYVSIFLAQQYRLKRIERATCPVRIRRGRGHDGLAALRGAWEAAGEQDRASFLEARALELQALSADSDKWLLWRVGVFERVVSKLGVRPTRVTRSLSVCATCGDGFNDLQIYMAHVSACRPAASSNGAPATTAAPASATEDGGHVA